MAVLFAGGEWESFTPSDGSPEVVTTTAYFDNAFARCAIRMGGSSSPNYAYAALPDPVSEIWFHCEIYRTNVSTGSTVWQASTSTGQGILRLQMVTSTPATLQYWNGTAWTTIGLVNLASNTLLQLDIHMRIADTGGVFEAFVNGVQVAVYTGDTNLFSGSQVKTITLGQVYNGIASTYWSQVIVTDTDDTRAMKLATLGPNADGALTEWTGSYTDVDEIGTYNDGDYISSGTPNQVELFGMSDLSATAATLDVIAFVMAGRGRKGAAGPQNVQMALRTSGVDYFSGNLPGLSPVFAALTQTIWPNNPSTSLPWSTSDINGIQAGFKSIA